MNDLQGSQNNFLSVWLNHYATRMILMRELGLMELDERGIWIDVPLDEALQRVEPCEIEELPPAVPQEWFEKLDAEPLPPPEPTESREESTLPEGRSNRLFAPPDDEEPELGARG